MLYYCYWGRQRRTLYSFNALTRILQGSGSHSTTYHHYMLCTNNAADRCKAILNVEGAENNYIVGKVIFSRYLMGSPLGTIKMISSVPRDSSLRLKTWELSSFGIFDNSDDFSQLLDHLWFFALLYLQCHLTQFLKWGWRVCFLK